MRFKGGIRERKDKGVDGYTEEGAPVQVKQSEGVGRPVVDSFEAAIRREGKEKGTIVAFSFTKGAVEECARVKRKEDLDIELKEVEELLKELKNEGKTPSTMFSDQEIKIQKDLGEFVSNS